MPGPPGGAPPHNGAGLLIVQQLPFTQSTEPEGAALVLNGIELACEPLGYGFGSYGWRDQWMYFISFYPNALYRRGLRANLIASCALRARSLQALFAQTDDKPGAAAPRVAPGASQGQA